MTSWKGWIPVGVFSAILLFTGYSIAHAADSDEFNAQAEQHKDDVGYQLIDRQDGSAELKPAAAKYERRKDIANDDAYILGGENEGKKTAQKADTPPKDDAPKQ